MKVCKKCGTRLDDYNRFCPHCGEPLAQDNEVGNEPCTPAFLANDAFAVGPKGISRGLAAVLAIIGGAFGIQYFYTRKTTAGIICLVFSLCSCGSLGALLGLVQGIYMFTLTNSRFYEIYVDNNNTFPLF